MQMIFLPFFFFFQLSYALFVWWFDLLNIGCNGFFLENCKISLSNNITSINLHSLLMKWIRWKKRIALLRGTYD